MWAKKAKCWFTDVCVLDGNFEVSCGFEGCVHCFLKVILIGNFKNQMFVILQGKSGPVPKKKKKNLAILYLNIELSVHSLLGLDQVRKLVF